MAATAATLQRPGEAVHRHIRALYEAVCYAIPCTECEALAGEPCRPYRLMASRSCAPPVAVATQDPHKVRRTTAWAAVYATTKALAALACPACGGRVDVRYPAAPLHVCVPRGPSSLDADVSAALGAEMGAEVAVALRDAP